ncbi:thermonuclease family protein [Gracilinema caldarium]|uniref:Nuclease (SNase domain-containing protein) n=1 Tax=Gracilinema caldarium (strain ATCC 51460 / DSM 7334 / H1) TaxID=744872 RepID=F8F186_GRAC1|nr:thermonuclease family protein [Gracilinema caldarium]AEJ18730.1 nuclease (SNase domain-containing protein) [Gracilinema caldarium DSM 7334]
MKHLPITLYKSYCLFFLLYCLFSVAVRAEQVSQDPSKIVVFRTPAGKKYHQKDCPTLQNSKTVTAITLEEALKQALEPCTVCHPPEYSGGRELYRLNNPPLRSSRDAQLSRMIPATVLEVVDGDTIKVRIPAPRPIQLKAQETIRFLGIDAPETKTSPRPAGYYGEEAKVYVTRLLSGKPVLLAFDWDLRDKYGRLLAYIYIQDGTCVNLHLVEQGYAFAYVHFPFQFMDEFTRAQAAAKQKRRGLWGR